MNIAKTYAEFFQQAREVYSWMADDQSKALFRGRFSWSGTDSKESVYDIVSHSCSLVKEATKTLGQDYRDLPSRLSVPVVIYGAGLGGKQVYETLCKNRGETIPSIQFMDRNAETIGTFCGLDVLSPSSVETLSRDTIFIICTSGATVKVRQFLLESHVDATQIYMGTEGDLEEQYFDDLLEFQENEVFADVGSYDGQTALEFIKRCPNYRKILCFEPEKSNIALLQKNLQSYENIELFEIGLWHEKDTLFFSEECADSSAISEEGTVQIPVNSLDEVLKGWDDASYPTFLKMDVEGAELYALKGAKYSIQLKKPKLAISIYHKPEDILELLIYLKELVPEYKFYLRHYTNHAYDTVVYALIP